MQRNLLKLRFNPVDDGIARLNANRNWLVILSGDTGSGKSYLAMSMAAMIAKRLDTRFDGWNVCFSVDSLLNRLDGIQPGTPLVFDEGGASFGSRRSMSKGNVAFSTILQVFRYLRIPLFFTVPRWSQIDISARRLANAHCHLLGYNKKTGETKFKYWRLQRPPLSSEEEILHTYPRVFHAGCFYKIETCTLPKPPDDVAFEYEEMAKIQKKSLILTQKPASDPYMELKTSMQTVDAEYYVHPDEQDHPGAPEQIPDDTGILDIHDLGAIRRKVDEGASVFQLSEESGHPIEDVMKAMTKAKRLKYPVLSDKKTLSALLDECDTHKTAMRMIGCSSPTFYAALKRLGLLKGERK